MKDKCQREIKHIRFSVTDNCNYNCIFCDNEGFIPTTNQLSVDEIIKTCRLLAEVLKVKRIKFTGGEPLCRREIVDIIRRINELGLYEDISMTTNGFLLDQKAQDLVNAGLDRVNVSLPSLKPNMYQKITASNSLLKVLKGLKTAKNVGLYPVKINYVVLKGLNDNELEEFIGFSARHGYILQLIELHTRSDAVGQKKEFYERYHVDLTDTIHQLEEEAYDVKIRGKMQNRKVLFHPNGAVIEIIHPSHEFCMGCTKLRVGCDGNLFGCLYKSDLGKNIRDDLHQDHSVAHYDKIFRTVIDSREPYY
ncbi:MAG: putative GTP 3',8-cyclase [Promethearchaeota archaeon]|nr:MAG: putative GTP 3',8-cyclase [Candidatus Lokiarchaeota archaeon]